MHFKLKLGSVPTIQKCHLAYGKNLWLIIEQDYFHYHFVFITDRKCTINKIISTRPNMYFTLCFKQHTYTLTFYVILAYGYRSYFAAQKHFLHKTSDRFCKMNPSFHSILQ